MTDEPLTLRGVPDLADIANMSRLLGELGVSVTGRHGTIKLQSMDRGLTHARYDVVRTMHEHRGKKSVSNLGKPA